MQLDAQEFLNLVEPTGSLCCFDIEATGTHGDYNSALVVSVKPFGKRPITLAADSPGDDRRLVRETRDLLTEFHCWVSFYGKGFDIPFLNTRLLRWRLPPIPKKPHVDAYFTLRSNTLTSRRSQAHFLAWLKTPQQKKTVSAEVWNEILKNYKRMLPQMKRRCESDTEGLEALYRRTRHLVRDITR